MAGYHLKNGIYRTAAVHHRLLKIITGNNSATIQALEEEAEVCTDDRAPSI